VLALSSRAAGQVPAVAPQFLILPGQGIGLVHLGMTIEQVRSVLGREARVTINDAATGVAILAWNTQGQGRFGVWFSNGQASYVGVNRDPRYATASGLRAGDPADKVRQVMGAPLNVVTQASQTLGRVDFLIYPGILFWIPSGATDGTLNGKVYSIVVSAISVQVTAPGQPAAPGQAQPALSQPAPTAPPSSPQASSPNRLYMVRIGPLLDRDRAAAIAKHLSAGGFAQVQVNAQTGYRVLSEPLPRTAAENLIATLAGRGFRADIEPSNGDTVQVLFGVFTTQEEAETLSSRIGAVGYDVWIREGTVYTLRLGPYPSASVNTITGLVKADAPEASVITDPIQ
jgi:cell division septation protein DedD